MCFQVLFRVRAQDPLELAAAQELARAGSGSGRDDIVWEYERGDRMRMMMVGGRRGGGMDMGAAGAGN